MKLRDELDRRVKEAAKLREAELEERQRQAELDAEEYRRERERRLEAVQLGNQFLIDINAKRTLESIRSEIWGYGIVTNDLLSPFEDKPASLVFQSVINRSSDPDQVRDRMQIGLEHVSYAIVTRQDSYANERVMEYFNYSILVLTMTQLIIEVEYVDVDKQRCRLVVSMRHSDTDPKYYGDYSIERTVVYTGSTVVSKEITQQIADAITDLILGYYTPQVTREHSPLELPLSRYREQQKEAVVDDIKRFYHETRKVGPFGIFGTEEVLGASGREILKRMKQLERIYG